MLVKHFLPRKYSVLSTQLEFTCLVVVVLGSPHFGWLKLRLKVHIKQYQLQFWDTCGKCSGITLLIIIPKTIFPFIKVVLTNYLLQFLLLAHAMWPRQMFTTYWPCLFVLYWWNVGPMFLSWDRDKRSVEIPRSDISLLQMEQARWISSLLYGFTEI